MSSHKAPPLKARNWEDLSEADDIDLPTFEKLRHHMDEKSERDRKAAGKSRHNTPRPRID